MSDADRLFLQLVVVLEAQAMVQLGKVVNPASQEVARDLDAARGTISLLEMLGTKTKGNLTEDEQNALSHILTGLRMNYLDELKKETAGAEAGAKQEESEGAAPPKGHPDAEPEDADGADSPEAGSDGSAPEDGADDEEADKSDKA